MQREAILPTFFTVCGLLLWLRGRNAFIRDQPGAGLVWLLLGLGGCTLLATLSKANGVLLPALALVIEGTWAGSVAPAPPVGPARRITYSRAMRVLAGVPTTLVGGYLLYEGWLGMAHGISATRPWTLGERLLTEPRILLDYLSLLWLPRPFTPGLFNDSIVASTSLWSPGSTAPSLLAVLALIAGSFMLRRRLPAVALSLLFFFTGQLVESTTIPLELYFEHRNYLPALLMFWPLALWLCDVPQRFGKPEDPHGVPLGQFRWLAGKLALGVVLLLGLVCMTHARAALWGNTRDQALLWAKLNPQSPRAQVNAAQVEIKSGFPERAVRRLEPALQRAPDELQVALNLLAAHCKLGNLDPASSHAAILALRTTRNPGALLTNWFDRSIDQADKPPCPQFTFELIKQLLDAAMANPALASPGGPPQDLHYLTGRLALAQHRPDDALWNFNQALDQQVRPTVAFQQAALLGSAGYPRQALAHLAHYEHERTREVPPPFGMPRIHAWVLNRQQYWDKELARLRNTLVADERALGGATR